MFCGTALDSTLSLSGPAFRGGLFKLSGDAAESRMQLRADAVDDRDDDNGNARGDQAIFNGRSSRLVFPESGEKLGQHLFGPRIVRRDCAQWEMQNSLNEVKRES